MNKLAEKLVDDATSYWNDYGKLFIASLSLIASAASLYAIATLTSPHRLRISFLDVGQGDAILVQTPSGHDLLIDGGPSDIVLTKMAREMNYFDRKLDVMLSTHDDADHVTGLIPVLQKYDIGTVIESPVRSDTDVARELHTRLTEETIDIRVGRRGDVVDFGDGVVMNILYPHASPSTKVDTNDASVSVVLSYGNHSFLLTGDLSTKYEPRLFNEGLPNGVTVYKAGHHGSKTSSGEVLLTYIQPEYTVISAGKDNRYGHPNVEAIGRLERYSREILSTIDRGTITFTSDGRTLEVDAEK